MRIISNEYITIDAIPLATKPPVIVDFKIIKEGKISTYLIVKADGSTKRYTSMINLLENIDIEDLETLWKLVKDKHKHTRPEEGYERVLWGDLKVIFEPDVQSEVWRQLQGYDVIVCKLFSLSGVHFLDEGMSKSEMIFKEIKMMFQQLMERLNEENQAKIEEMYQVTYTSEPSRRFNSICYDDDEEHTIPLSDIISQLPPSIVITTSLPVLPIEDPEDSLIMGNEDFNTILEKKSDEFIKSSIEDLVPIPRKSVTFFNPLFDSNDDFTSIDDESLSDKDVLEDNIQIYSNLLFEFDDEYISSNVNPLFNEVLENIKSKDSYDSNLDEPDLLVTPLSDANEDECFDPRGNFDEIDAFLDIDTSTDVKDGYHDSEGDIIYLKSLLTNKTIPSHPSDVFLDHDTKSLKDESVIDYSKNMVKIFDPGIHEKIFLQHILSCSWLCPSSTRASILRIWEYGILDLVD
nr:hypothetical protein [Tanacetum cinerariifolium]